MRQCWQRRRNRRGTTRIWLFHGDGEDRVEVDLEDDLDWKGTVKNITLQNQGKSSFQLQTLTARKIHLNNMHVYCLSQPINRLLPKYFPV